jgi:hypothetical protein
VTCPWASTCTTTGMTVGLNSTSDPDDDAIAVPANAAMAQAISDARKGFMTNLLPYP